MQNEERTRIRIVGLAILAVLVGTLLLLPLLLQVILSDTHREPVVRSISTVVDSVPGVRGVAQVDIILLNPEDEQAAVSSLQIIYITGETGMLGYRAEIVEVFRAVGISLVSDSVMVDQVMLMPALGPDAIIELVTAEIDNLNALLEGNLTRSDFLDTLEITLVEGIGSHTESTTGL